MVRIRISGLVREATWAEEALRQGIPEAERGRFLARTIRAVEEVERILDENDLPAEALPPRSKGALATLRRLAALGPRDLPLPRPDAPPPSPKARVRNVTACLDRCLEPLADGRAEEATLDRVHRDALSSADAVLALCRAQGVTTAGLSLRSRHAYALLRWLSDRANLEAYVAQVRRALPILATLEEWGGGFGGEAAGLPARVRFVLGRKIYRVRGDGEAVAWELSLGLLQADGEDLRALVARAALKSRAPRVLLERYHALVTSEDFGAFVADVEMLADPSPYRPKGRVRDLDLLFNRLDATYFGGSLDRPNLHWAARPSRRLFGFHISSRDLVCLNPILDDPEVPEFVAEFVLYHELLHKKHGVTLLGGRRHVHTPAFRVDEALHPRRDEAERWLHRLAGAEGLLVAASEVPGEDANEHPHEDPVRDPGPDPDQDRDQDPDQDPAEPFPPDDAPADLYREPPRRRAPREEPLCDVCRCELEHPEQGCEPAARDVAGRAVPGRAVPGRNDPCWCGSGVKYKRCHLAADEGADGT